MKTFTVENIREWNPCYDPVTGIDANGDQVNDGFLPEGWSGAALDILRVTDCSPEDRLWVVAREECIDARTLRLFAVWCARQALVLIDEPDPRSVEACNVAERYANGDATNQELAAARAAAWDAAWAAAWAAASAAQIDHLITLLEIEQSQPSRETA